MTTKTQTINKNIVNNILLNQIFLFSETQRIIKSTLENNKNGDSKIRNSGRVVEDISRYNETNIPKYNERNSFPELIDQTLFNISCKFYPWIYFYLPVKKYEIQVKVKDYLQDLGIILQIIYFHLKKMGIS